MVLGLLIKMITITNKVYNKLWKDIENWIEEELEETIDASQMLEIMNIILNNLGIKKEFSGVVK